MTHFIQYAYNYLYLGFFLKKKKKKRKNFSFLTIYMHNDAYIFRVYVFSSLYMVYLQVNPNPN
jgi:hypothetical protein